MPWNRMEAHGENFFCCLNFGEGAEMRNSEILGARQRASLLLTIVDGHAGGRQRAAAHNEELMTC